VELSEETAAIALARALRDAGAEVVHVGHLDTAEKIARTAEQEDPDILGLLGGPAPAGLAEALSGTTVLELGGESVEMAAEMLLGGRSHTLGTPSDRAR
jgi:methylmalonyl-CoA mutase C-terminal domain/subunit